MNWRKLLRYLVLLITLLTIVGWILAEREITKIFGGLTQEVAPEKFLANAEPIFIENINVLVQDGTGFKPNQSVLLKDGLISLIDTAAKPPKGVKLVNGKDKFLIPGLIDSHVHLFKSPNDLLLYLANGVTGIREMDGRKEHISWRKEIEDGVRVGPEIYITSPRTGSYGKIEGWFLNWTQGLRSINDEEDAQQFIDEMAEKGYDAIKVYSELNVEAYNAISKLAPTKGLDVVGHIPFTISDEQFLASNQEEVAHLEELMKRTLWDIGGYKGIWNEEDADRFLGLLDTRMQKLAPKLAEQDIVVTTTLWLMETFVPQKFELDAVLGKVALVYENPGISEWNENIPGLGWLPKVNRYGNRVDPDSTPEELEGLRVFWKAYAEGCKVVLRNLRASGVKIVVGTDANVPVAVPGFSLHDEMISLNEAGMTPVEVLRSTTQIPGEWLGNNTGSIKEGAKANLLVLDKNPLEAIQNTKSINALVINGKYYTRAQLDAMLEAVKEANDESRTVPIEQY